MRVRYLSHSGFYVEGERHAMVFDYWHGELPPVPEGKRLFIFASHHHPDHYDAEIFRYGESVAGTRYILGCDITLNAANRQRMGISDEIFARCHRMHKDDRLDFGEMRVRAIRSTDMGVAFSVECDGRRLYHGGDHNLWLWREDANFDRAQTNRFYEEIEKLRGLHYDAAFLPLDPRLGEEYWRGFDAFARLIDTERLFPMHMAEDYDIVRRMREAPCSQGYRDKIADIKKEGDSFDI